MNRNEKTLAALAVALVAGVVCLVVFASAWLNGQAWFGTSANVVQLISAPGLFAAVVTALWIRWSRRCAVPLCLRLGEHPVASTQRKVCGAHHRREHHLLVRELHRIEGRLGWGESIDDKEEKR